MAPPRKDSEYQTATVVSRGVLFDFGARIRGQNRCLRSRPERAHVVHFTVPLFVSLSSLHERDKKSLTTQALDALVRHGGKRCNGAITPPTSRMRGRSKTKREGEGTFLLLRPHLFERLLYKFLGRSSTLLVGNVADGQRLFNPVCAARRVFVGFLPLGGVLLSIQLLRCIFFKEKQAGSGRDTYLVDRSLGDKERLSEGRYC